MGRPRVQRLPALLQWRSLPWPAPLNRPSIHDHRNQYQAHCRNGGRGQDCRGRVVFLRQGDEGIACRRGQCNGGHIEEFLAGHDAFDTLLHNHRLRQASAESIIRDRHVFRVLRMATNTSVPCHTRTCSHAGSGSDHGGRVVTPPRNSSQSFDFCDGDHMCR